jgi:hypothetical protein
MDLDKPVDALVICVEGKINSYPVGTLLNDEYYENKGTLTEDLIKTGNGMYAYLSFAKLKDTLESLKNKTSALMHRKRESEILREKTKVLYMS